MCMRIEIVVSKIINHQTYDISILVRNTIVLFNGMVENFY